MHIVCSVTKRGWLYTEHIHFDHTQLAENLFNQDFSSKVGFKYLLCSPYAQPPAGADNNIRPARHTIPAKLNPELVEGIVKAVGVFKYIGDNYALADYVLDNFEKFWELKEQGHPDCVGYFETFISSVGSIKRAVNGVPVAIATPNDEVIDLKDVGYKDRSGKTYKVFIKEKYSTDEKVLAKLIQEVGKMVESQELEQGEGSY